MAAASGVTYAEPGYLLFERDQKLVAQRFDLSRLEVTGEPIPIGEPPLAHASWDATWIATASADGRLASLRSWPQRTEVEWVDRSGRVLHRVPLPAGQWLSLALAPDGQSVLASRPVAATLSEIWLFDVKGVKIERVAQPADHEPRSGVGARWAELRLRLLPGGPVRGLPPAAGQHGRSSDGPDR